MILNDNLVSAHRSVSNSHPMPDDTPVASAIYFVCQGATMNNISFFKQAGLLLLTSTLLVLAITSTSQAPVQASSGCGCQPSGRGVRGGGR